MLRNVMNLSETELEVYQRLLSSEGQRVSDMARVMGKDRSSIQRSLKNLMTAGLTRRETETIENGGYYYSYEAVPPAQVKKELERCIEDWHESVLDSLSRFEKEMEVSHD
jgi:predicted transcriptional regulator